MNEIQGANEAHYQGTLVFMTDPICSWCWGMLPEVNTLRQHFSEQLRFELKCAGLQVGAQKPLTEFKRAELMNLWRNVAETTGQTFAFELPKDETFIYHSELACRTLQIARAVLGKEPWDVFEAIQRGFYLDSCNIVDPDTLYGFLAPYNLDYESFTTAIIDDAVVAATRDEFNWCETQGISALPTLFLDRGHGLELICGGYATAEFMIPDIVARLETH